MAIGDFDGKVRHKIKEIKLGNVLSDLRTGLDVKKGDYIKMSGKDFEVKYVVKDIDEECVNVYV